jgi:hypothetical protein
MQRATGGSPTALTMTALIAESDLGPTTNSSYSVSEVVYKLQAEGSYFDIEGPLHLMTIDEEDEEEDPPKPTMELPQVKRWQPTMVLLGDI